MNENDRTTLEQAIYEEMELTPEMIRSIRTLCGVCLCSFVESKAFKIAIVPSADRESSGSRSSERCGKFLLAYADRSHIDKQGGKKVYPADTLPAGERFSLRSVHRSGRSVSSRLLKS